MGSDKRSRELRVASCQYNRPETRTDHGPRFRDLFFVNNSVRSLPVIKRYFWIFVCVLAAACAPRLPGQAERERAELEARILRREDERSLGGDGFFEAVLREGRDDVRARALLAIGRVGDSAGLPLLYQHVKHPDQNVRAMSAFALGEMLDEASLQEQGLQAPAEASSLLLALLDDPAPSVRIRATEALGKLRSRDAVPALAERLPHRQSAPSSQRDAWIACAMTACLRIATPEAEELAGRYLDWPAPEVASRAINALARLRSRRFLEKLKVLLQAPHASVRALAVRALANDPQEPIGLVAPLLSDSDQQVRLNALNTLGRYGGAAAAGLIAASLARIPGDAPRQDLLAVAHLQALGLAGVSAVVPAILPSLYQRGSRANAAVRALGKIFQKKPGSAEESPAFFESTAGFVISDFWAAKNWSLALGDQGSSEAATELRQILAEESARMPAELQQRAKVFALDALIQIAPPGLKKDLLRQCIAPDPVLRAHAISGLAQERLRATVTRRELERVYSATWLAHPSETVADARLALLQLLEKVSSPQARLYAESLLEAPDRNTRMAAARIAGLAKTPAATTAQAARPPYFYRDLILQQRQPAFVVFETERGTIELELYRRAAPLTVANFLGLASRGFFDGLSFHRVVPNFVVQGGDPREDMEGGPGYAIRCEINLGPFERGTLGMALAGKDTGGSQFFICHSAQPHLDGGYTAFGRVISGMEVVDQLVEGDKIIKVTALPKTTRLWSY